MEAPLRCGTLALGVAQDDLETSSSPVNRNHRVRGKTDIEHNGESALRIGECKFRVTFGSSTTKATMTVIQHSEVEAAFERAVQEQGKSFRVSSLFTKLPSLQEIIRDVEATKKTTLRVSLKDGEEIDPANLSNIPPEILLMIFPNLTRVSSTCLGLTCKAFYAIHRNFIPAPVGLHEQDRIYCCNLVPLYKLLKEWKGPGLVSVQPSNDRCFYVKTELVEAWLRKGVGMKGFLGIKEWN